MSVGKDVALTMSAEKQAPALAITDKATIAGV